MRIHTSTQPPLLLLTKKSLGACGMVVSSAVVQSRFKGLKVTQERSNFGFIGIHHGLMPLEDLRWKTLVVEVLGHPVKVLSFTCIESVKALTHLNESIAVGTVIFSLRKLLAQVNKLCLDLIKDFRPSRLFACGKGLH